jgi:hypothetical protein
VNTRAGVADSYNVVPGRLCKFVHSITNLLKNLIMQSIHSLHTKFQELTQKLTLQQARVEGKAEHLKELCEIDSNTSSKLNTIITTTENEGKDLVLKQQLYEDIAGRLQTLTVKRHELVTRTNKVSEHINSICTSFLKLTKGNGSRINQGVVVISREVPKAVIGSIPSLKIEYANLMLHYFANSHVQSKISAIIAHERRMHFSANDRLRIAQEQKKHVVRPYVNKHLDTAAELGSKDLEAAERSDYIGYDFSISTSVKEHVEYFDNYPLPPVSKFLFDLICLLSVYCLLTICLMFFFSAASTRCGRRPPVYAAAPCL